MYVFLSVMPRKFYKSTKSFHKIMKVRKVNNRWENLSYVIRLKRSNAEQKLFSFERLSKHFVISHCLSLFLVLFLSLYLSFTVSLSISLSISLSLLVTPSVSNKYIF